MDHLREFFTTFGPYVVLCCAAVLFVFCMWRCRSWLTIIATFAGAALLSGVWFFSFDGDDTRSLRAKLENAEQRIVEFDDALIASQKNLEVELERRSDLLQAQARWLERLHRKASLDDQESPLDFGTPTNETNFERFRAANDRIARLKQLAKAGTAKNEISSPPADFGELARLRDKLTYGYKTEDYDVEVLPDNELIGGQKGKYYVVDLKNAESGLKFQFPGGKYTLSRSNKSFRRALNAFTADVAGKMEGNVRYGFFVRGSADSVPYRGRLIEGYEYREVNFLKAVGNGRYQLGAQTHDVPPAIRNNDLPFLRAQFLKEVVADTYPVKPPVILEGAITDRKNNEDRNVELILYVDW